MQKLRSAFGLLLLGATLALHPAQAVIIGDAAGDIDPGIASGGGTLDILSMEVTNTATDLVFTLTVNGNTSTVDWGNFMIGIATGGTGSTTSNGWVRPIRLDSPIGGMDYWVGSWADGGGGSQVWSYDGSAWTNTGPAPGFSMSAGINSSLTYTLSLTSLGLNPGDTIYFDAYSSGGGGNDSAVDALSNPYVSITSWDQLYTSNTTNGISSYTVIPEPSTYAALLGLAALGVVGLRRRLRR